jgi:hypothetical protein
MKNTLIFGLLICIFLTSLVSATEVNYNESAAHFVQIQQLKYEPYPVNPGEYFDLWIKVQYAGAALPQDTIFELKTEYPFSLDSNEDPIRSYGGLNGNSIVLNYKVRVDKNAVEGINELKLDYNSMGNTYTKVFDIQVANAQTDFDLVVQESTGTEVSIAIANTGKNTANSLIVRIPEQDNFKVSGTNGQMVGNLASGDYSIVSFSLVSVGRVTGEGILAVEMDYTDNIGERRSVIKNISFSPDSSGLNATSQGYGNFTGRFAGTQNNSNSIFKSIWFWAIIVIIGGIAYYLYRKYPKEIKHLLSQLNKNKLGSEKSSKGTPEWVSAERTKKK